MMGEYPALSPEDIEAITAQAHKTRPQPQIIADCVSIERRDTAGE